MKKNKYQKQQENYFKRKYHNPEILELKISGFKTNSQEKKSGSNGNEGSISIPKPSIKKSNDKIKPPKPEKAKREYKRDSLWKALRKIVGSKELNKYIKSNRDLERFIKKIDDDNMSIHEWFYEGQPEPKGGFTIEELPYNRKIAKTRILEYLEDFKKYNGSVVDDAFDFIDYGIRK